MSKLRFTTPRLTIAHWRSALDDPGKRRLLETELTAILTARVLQHLPPSLQLEGSVSDLSAWIDARDGESDILLVKQREGGALVGLMILAVSPDDETGHEIHLGYLLAHEFWGRGLATELLTGFVRAAEKDGPATLLGGVSKENPASARVLFNAGFIPSPERSGPGTDMFIRMIE